MSLPGYVTSINDQLALLRKDVRELKQENKELKAQLTHAHHRWWVSRDDETFNTEDLIDDLIYSSNQPDYLKFR